LANYIEDYITNYQPENPRNELIFRITNHIKYDNDYDNAIRIILENNLKLEDIAKTTVRLTRKQIITLASRLISHKTN